MSSLLSDTSGASFTDVALSLASRSIPHESAKSLLDRLLPALKAWTGSTLAFGATLGFDKQGECLLMGGTGDEVLREQQTLWDVVLRDQQAWIVSPPQDPRLSSLMGWPLRHGSQLVGVIALANRATGYDEALLRSLHTGLVIVAGLLATALLTQNTERSLHSLTYTADALRTSEQQYRHIFEAAGVGMARVSLQGRLLDVNQRFADIAGRPRETLIGLSFLDITHPEDAATDWGLLESCLTGQRERYTMDKRYVRPDGSVVWVALSVVLVRNAQGRPLYFISVVEDISERRHFEEAMTSAKAAERASKAKTEFLSRMSHELRTPLNAMLGFAQLLRVDPRSPLSDLQTQKVLHIERAGAHLLAMLTDVLDLSRIEAGSLPLALEPLDISAVLQEASSLVSNQAREAQLQLQITWPDTPIYALADQVRLRQILVNLLTNAIKYNRPQGRVMLEAMTLSPHVMLTVSDTGKGLSTEQQQHLFEPFNRLGAERTHIEGTGIGLVIVKRLVDLMHGRLEVSSTPDVGSIFRVWLPQARMTVAPSPAPTEDRLLSPRASGFGALDGAEPAQMTVLYAEDNPINVELVRQVLRMRPQWHLEIARSGAQAIEMAQSQPPDLLLLDMHLGDMNGTDVSDALSQQAHTANIPRVALSADVMPDQIREARERGFVEYLSKPLEVARLLKILDRCAPHLSAAEH
ncbi:MAG: PAS domain S-box protein [Burkholderiales bacterium]|nr:PAS domain S-box protein [Burkholderiales bacterium]